MTPKGKTVNSTIIQVERRKVADPPVGGGSKGDVHVGGGQHSGIIVNKTVCSGGSTIIIITCSKNRIS